VCRSGEKKGVENFRGEGEGGFSKGDGVRKTKRAADDSTGKSNETVKGGPQQGEGVFLHRWGPFFFVSSDRGKKPLRVKSSLPKKKNPLLRKGRPSRKGGGGRLASLESSGSLLRKEGPLSFQESFSGVFLARGLLLFSDGDGS